MVSIIILSYKTKLLLEKCLLALLRNTKGVAHEVIVVDNHSKDGTVEMLKEKYSEVVVTENSKNVGFSKGNNVGAKKAKEKYLLFLNSDTEMVGEAVREMSDFLNEHKDTAVVGGQLKNLDGSIQRSYGSFYSLPEVLIMLFGGERFELLRHSHQVAREVDWVSGGFMMVRNEIFQKLNGFDEHFFMYIEDMEFCLRVKKLGASVYFLPYAQSLHIGQGSSDRSFAIMHICKGLLYFYKKHKSVLEYALLRGLIITKAVFGVSVGLVTNNAYLRNTYTQVLKHSV